MTDRSSSAPPAQSLTYADAGVDITRGERAVDAIKQSAARTCGPGVLGGLGGFGGLFALKDAGVALDDPVLVAGTDGVGTKLLLALDAGCTEGLGQDLVAMCVNDILCVGARPLFFLDYYATAVLSPARMASVVDGIARACQDVGCALLGGETAELPGLYQPGHFDLAGFAVGVVERDKMIDPRTIAAGDVVIGLPSTGLHANGFSLARKIVHERMGLSAGDPWPGGPDEATVADVLLAPTRLYHHVVFRALERGVPLRGLAHITGGGLTENLTRGFPAGLGARLHPDAWVEPALFDILRTRGPVEDDEMRRTFNLGVGMCAVVPKSAEADALEALSAPGLPATSIGIVEAPAGVRFA